MFTIANNTADFEFPEWWQRKGARFAKVIERTSIDRERLRLMPRRDFNPQCQHDRTTYSIVTCEACKAFSEGRLTP